MTLLPLKLGPLVLCTPVLAAPVAGFTDAIFRAVVRRFGGCGLLFTEMISALAWVESDALPERLRGVESERRPLGVQIWGRRAGAIEEASRRLAGLDVSLVDLNFGCPKRRIVGKHGSGARLLRDPRTVGRLVGAAVRGAGAVPVTAKIRLGPSCDRPTAPDVARAAEENGAVAVTVHGRTADQNYGTPSCYEKIAEVVDAVSIPVIANGDVMDGASALHALRATAAAGVMVGREALTRPWVFREITAALRGRPIPPPPTIAEQGDLLLRHHRAVVDREGDRWGTITMRKFAARYLSGLPGSRPFRDAINRTESTAEFRAVVRRFVSERVAS